MSAGALLGGGAGFLSDGGHLDEVVVGGWLGWSSLKSVVYPKVSGTTVVWFGGGVDDEEGNKANSSATEVHATKIDRGD